MKLIPIHRDEFHRVRMLIIKRKHNHNKSVTLKFYTDEKHTQNNV